MKKLLVLSFLLSVSFQFAFSQSTTTVVMRPHFNGIETLLMRLDSTAASWPGNPYQYASAMPDSTSPIINYLTWTFSGCPGVVRFLIQFADISNPAVIPPGKMITSAKMYLYGLPDNSPTGDYGNSTYPGSPYLPSGPNTGWLYELTSPFYPHTTNWNTQPNIKHNDSVAIPESVMQWNNNDTLDVTPLVADLYATGNTGFEMRLQTETQYRQRNYASSRHPDSNLHPMLIVTFTDSIPTTSVPVDYQACNLSFPNAFTPNGDGKNDIIKAIGTLDQFKECSLGIFNRLGRRVYYTENIYDGWDGTLNGVKQDIGTYFYMLNYTLRGKKNTLKGDFLLIR